MVTKAKLATFTNLVDDFKFLSGTTPEFIKLMECCNNDCVMFVHYMSLCMRINNKKPFKQKLKLILGTGQLANLLKNINKTVGKFKITKQINITGKCHGYHFKYVVLYSLK